MAPASSKKRKKTSNRATTVRAWKQDGVKYMYKVILTTTVCSSDYSLVVEDGELALDLSLVPFESYCTSRNVDLSLPSVAPREIVGLKWSCGDKGGDLGRLLRVESDVRRRQTLRVPPEEATGSDDSSDDDDSSEDESAPLVARRGKKTGTSPNTVMSFEIRLRETVGSSLMDFLDDESLTDLTLTCQDQKLKCHRLVLAARSPIFRAMFREGSFREGRDGVVDIVDMTMDELKVLVKFMYTDKIDNLSKHAQRLMVLADKYDMPSLRDKCVANLESTLTVDNVLEMMEVASASNAPKLAEAAKDFLKNHIKEMDKYSQQLRDLIDQDAKLAKELVFQLM